MLVNKIWGEYGLGRVTVLGMWDWAFNEVWVESRRLWWLNGQQVQHGSGRGSWISEIHMWLWVVNTETKITGNINHQSSIENLPGCGIHQRIGVVLNHVSNFQALFWMPFAKYMGESREMSVVWGRKVAELGKCNCGV